MSLIKQVFSKKIIFPVVSILLGILVVSGVFEIVLRIGGYSPGNVNTLSAFHDFDPLLGHRGKKNFTGRFKRPEFEVTVANDENGFRRQEFRKDPSSCSRRIFILGDSFTWGWGVNQGEVFTDRMNLMMPSYCVYNFGIDSTGTAAQYLLFDSGVRKLVQPGDTVVVMFFDNDFDDNLSVAEARNGAVQLLKQERPSDRFIDRNMKKISYFYNYLAYKIDLFQLNRRRKRQISIAQDLMTLREKDPRNTIEKHFLAAFKNAAAEPKADFILAYIPGQAELSESDIMRPDALANEQAYRKALFSISEALGIQTLDILPYFLEYKKNNNNKTLTFKRDEHWNPAGHRVAAEVISDFIVRKEKKNPAKHR